MSLHIGNLSSRIRRDELERVFQRFGQCTIRVKDKFGFVMYDYPANAEKALCTLRGKKICGERITVSWSNKQPRAFQRNPRSGRRYEPPQERHFERGDYANRNLASDVRDSHRRSFRQADGGGGRLGSPDVIEGAKGHFNDMEAYVGENHHDFVQDLRDEGGGVETNLLENDRWGEQVVANELENGLDFDDRYETYLDDDGKEQEGIHTYLGSSPPVRRSHEKPKTKQVDQLKLEHRNNSKPQNPCHACGEVGHAMRKWPQQLKGLETKSSGRLCLDRDVGSTGWHKNDRDASNSRSHLRLLACRDSSEPRLTLRGVGKDYREKKRSRKKYGTPEKYQLKKARVPVSSSINSDYTASGSRSQARSRRSLSGSRPRSRSKSLPARKISMSSRSRSGSTSIHPRAEKVLPRVISRSSSSTSLSLSVSPGQPLLSSPNKMQVNEKDCLVNPSGVEFKEGSVDVENQSSGAPLKPEEYVNNSNSPRREDAHNHSFMGDVCGITKSCLPQSENSDQNAGNFASKMFTEMKEFNSDELVREDKLIPAKDSEIDASGSHHAASLMNLSSKEICMVLKNYGLEQPNEIEENLPPEVYFGSARLWPWEIIYYRRLRKGPISKDNYARRLYQNEEFKIVDKYIRSSSGWRELADKKN